MKVVYTAPNRSHHYIYAKGLNKHGVLKNFISGFSRFSPRSALPELGKKLVRADLLQTLYVILLRLNLPEKFNSKLAYWSKLEQDKACRRYLSGADIFVFYNGSGLESCRYAKKKGVITVTEAVNSHVDYQEKLLAAEHTKLNIPFEPFNAIEKARRIKEYEEADYILLPSDFVKNSFIEYGFPEEKLLKVPYGFHIHSQQVEINIKRKEEFNILYVGSISVRKGIRYLIEAFKNLDCDVKKLTIVGPEANPSGIKDIDVPEGVTFTGSLKGIELENAYKSADVFCLPSIEEGFALVLGEALSYGVPVIATTNTGIKELITEGKEGFVVPVGSAEAFCDKLQYLADNEAALQQMKENAVKASSNLKGWDHSIQMLISKLEAVLKLKN